MKYYVIFTNWQTDGYVKLVERECLLVGKLFLNSAVHFKSIQNNNKNDTKQTKWVASRSKVFHTEIVIKQGWKHP